MKLVYKIVPAKLWAEAQTLGIFKGSKIDIDDGFIHLSSFEQVLETALKHFKGLEDLLIVAFKDVDLAPDLKWEDSRNGKKFPHYYNKINIKSVFFVKPLPLDIQGNHIFPDLIHA